MAWQSNRQPGDDFVHFLKQVVPTLYTDIRGHKIATNQVCQSTSSPELKTSSNGSWFCDNVVKGSSAKSMLMEGEESSSAVWRLAKKKVQESFSDSGLVLQFSVTEHFIKGGSGSRYVPGLFFIYDLSPIKVRWSILFPSYFSSDSETIGSIAPHLNLAVSCSAREQFLPPLPSSCCKTEQFSLEKSSPMTNSCQLTWAVDNDYGRWNLWRKGCLFCIFSQMCVR